MMCIELGIYMTCRTLCNRANNITAIKGVLVITHTIFFKWPFFYLNESLVFKKLKRTEPLLTWKIENKKHLISKCWGVNNQVSLFMSYEYEEMGGSAPPGGHVISHSWLDDVIMNWAEARGLTHPCNLCDVIGGYLGADDGETFSRSCTYVFLMSLWYKAVKCLV